MAFTKIEQLGSLIASLPDRVTGQADWLKAYFDANPTQIMEAFNALVDELKAATAADQIGYSAGDGINAGTVQAAIAALKDMLDAAVTGTIPDGSLTGEKIGDGQVGESKLTAAVQGKLNGGHAHGSLTSDGKIGASSGRVVVTGENGALQAETKNTAHNRNFAETAGAAASASGTAGTADTVARGDHTHPTQRVRRKTALETPLADNTRYTVTESGAITLAYPAGTFECSVYVTFTGTAAGVTFPSGTLFLGSVPEWETGKSYEISIVDGVAVVTQAGDGT